MIGKRVGERFVEQAGITRAGGEMPEASEEIIARGVFDTRDLVFYGTVVAASLVMAVQSLAARNWK